MAPVGTMASSRELLDAAAAAYRRVRGRGVRFGVDLGTATCVLVAVDADGIPVWVDSRPTAAVRDGVVVDFFGARDAVIELKADAENALGVEVTAAGTAYPPGIPRADARACAFVLEAAGIEDVHLMDEVSAAQAALGLRDAILVDVGGGSTGVGVFRGGALERVDDRPGGGHHLDLILAGALGVDLAEAERLKRVDSGSYTAVLAPGLQRIASSIRTMSAGAEDLEIHLAGGAVMIEGAAAIISAAIGQPVHVYPHSLFITPVGIARSPS